MGLNRLSRALHLTNRTVRDVNALQRSKAPERVVNRVIGRASSRVMSRLWRR